jgi:hypothetical protein
MCVCVSLQDRVARPSSCAPPIAASPCALLRLVVVGEQGDAVLPQILRRAWRGARERGGLQEGTLPGGAALEPHRDGGAQRTGSGLVEHLTRVPGEAVGSGRGDGRSGVGQSTEPQSTSLGQAVGALLKARNGMRSQRKGRNLVSGASRGYDSIRLHCGTPSFGAACFCWPGLILPALVTWAALPWRPESLPSSLHPPSHTQMWFSYYRRDGQNDSCGFEHVFVGESKGDSITGFHNWIQVRCGTTVKGGREVERTATCRWVCEKPNEISKAPCWWEHGCASRGLNDEPWPIVQTGLSRTCHEKSAAAAGL